jgi:hypothetical protein
LFKEVVMAGQKDVLKALISKEVATKTDDLAKELRTTEANTRALCSKLKNKNLVDGDTKEGWYITDAGKEVMNKDEEVPTTLKDSGKDELSKFKYYGQVAGAEPDDIAAASELFRSTDMRDINEIQRCLAEAAVPMNCRTRWINLYRNYLRDTTPPADRDVLYPLPRAEEVLTRAGPGTSTKQDAGSEDGLDFIVEGTEVHRTEPGLGDFTFRQALQVVAAKRGSVPRGSTESDLTGALTAFSNALKNTNPNQPLTINDMITLVERIKGNSGEKKNQATGYIDEDGEWHETLPGHPIVIRKEIQANPQKTIVVRQTPQGVVTEEVQPGQPIIIQTAAPPSGNNPMAMMPFPVIGSDGKPVTDAEGRPVYANIEPMLKWMGFARDEQRKDERHQALMGLAQTVRENASDGIQALKEAAQEVRTQRQAGGTKQEAGPPTKQVYECGECKTQFRLPDNPNWAQLECPGCHLTWTREEVMKL